MNGLGLHPPRVRPPHLLGVMAFLAVAAVVVFGWGGAQTATTVSDGASVVAAVVAGVACATAAQRTRHRRRGWALLAVACGLWAAGEVLWAVWEVILGDAVPFPSAADVAYLAAVPFALMGLLSFAPRGRYGERARTLLDGCLVSGSLLFAAWALVLGPAWHSGGRGSLAHIINVAYPATDVALAAVAILVLQAGRAADRRPLHLVSLGLLVMAVTDMAFTWTVNHGTYASTNPISLGWPATYLLLAAGAWAARRDHHEPAATPPPTSLLSILLPYVPLLLAGAVAAPRVVEGRPLGTFLTINALALLAIIGLRQGVSAFALQRSVAALHQREGELARLALHDPLTGLANRTQFAARFHEVRRRPGARPAVLYIDLDDFKAINDRYGHATGDLMLVEAGERLRRCLHEDMLLARLGGDEFVVLVDEGRSAAEHLAAQIIEALAPPCQVAGDTVSFRASIGVASATKGTSDDEALRRADAAMYAAKARGKGRAVRYEDELLGAEAVLSAT